MVLVRKIRSRVSGKGIGVIEANAEVLFSATGDVGRWQNRFSQRARAAAAAAAPSNKRPRWSHYGKALRTTFTATTKYQPGRMKVYSAIGSSAPHAYYVDQGTGVHAGNGPYKAKILPPWQRGEGSLYEHTWRPGGEGGRVVRPVYIKGQEGQGFFDKGLRRAFQSMRMRSFQVPGEGGPKIAAAVNSIPSGLLNFAGNTAADGAFRQQLDDWREWRGNAWSREGVLGRQENPQRRPVTPSRPSKPKKTRPPKPPKPKGPSRASLAADRARVLAAAIKHYGAGNVETHTLEFRDGFWYITVRTKDSQGRNVFKEVKQRARV